MDDSCLLPSGNLLPEAIENRHESSGFTMIYPLKMADLSIVFCERLPEGTTVLRCFKGVPIEFGEFGA